MNAATMPPPLATGATKPQDTIAIDGWVPTLFKVWVVLALFLAVQALPLIANQSGQEPDDYVRLLQVRDLLNGQAWFDSRQYRMDSPIGADIHWVRLVDIPIAVSLWFFKLFLSGRFAETAAMIVVPLGQMAVAMLVLRELMRGLTARTDEILLAIAVIPLFPLLMTNFMPMRIDHHGWQAIGALTAVWLLVRGGYRGAALAGLACAAWLFISVEGVPLVALVGGLYALRYWIDGKREVEGFMLGLALGGPALFVVLRPLGDFGSAYCDMLSWPHFLAFGGSALALLAARVLPGQSHKVGRLLAMVPVPLIAAPALIVPLGICAVSPMSTLDPVLREHWFRHLIESAPIWRQNPSTAAMLVATIVIVALGARLTLRRAETARQREGWAFLAVAALFAGAISLLVMRGGIIAQMLALPFAGAILAELLPRARELVSTPRRIGATLGCFLLATPVFASGATKFFDAKNSYTLVAHPHLNEDGPCDIEELNAFPKANMFATLDRGPEILVRTPHSVIMGGYHRNQKKMIEVFHAFSGPLDQARRIIRANHADYVMACTGSPDLAAYANYGKGNLADGIFAKQVPAWLEPVPGYATGNLRVYRVR